ncbi:RNA polymerase sigma factor [Porphyromonas sp.]|uniref:RNA polymerase sigma factor n=1 Tax=Porphyromonas sp. TaxID=1924944 RepID=UPI0026DD4008|nr:RNA polymerase sigma factor [Porphyromonas sp.]MDO4771063.1 RNA polymerase sigma factor [Porphyromonas sp.]
MSDEELLLCLKDSMTSESAFSVLVDRYSRPLYVIIRRIVLSHENADDVLQNTLIKIWKNIPQFRGASKLSTWMYSIATNEAITYLRQEQKNKKRSIATENSDLTQSLASDPYFDGDRAEAAFLSAIDKLPEKQKITFQMRYFEELSYREIAEITGTSIGALKANYHHALNKLQQYLKIDSIVD